MSTKKPTAGAKRWPSTRPAASAALLVALGVEHGASLPALTFGTGLDVVVLHDPATEIAADDELRLVANLLDAVDVPGLGFLAGQRYHFGMHGLWSYAVLNSPDLGSALSIGIRYAELTYSFVTPGLLTDGDQVHLTLDTSGLPEELVPFLVERELTAAASIFSALMGRTGLPAESASFTWPAPADPTHRDGYAHVLGVEPVWEADSNRLRVPADLLGLTLTSSSPAAAAEAQHACEELLTRRRRRGGFAGEVRSQLAHGTVTTEQVEVAAALHVSLRTLRRRLADEGTTYRELAQETFGLLAEELLASGLTVEQVADRLGYGGASSFTRAFKAWKGVSPGNFARSRQTRH